MSKIALESVLKTSSAMSISSDEMKVKSRRETEKVAEESTNEVKIPKRNYTAQSKDGDTVELSENGSKKGAHMDADNLSLSGKTIIADKKLSDTTLAGYTESKLKQLYVSKKITKIQYDRIMKKKNNI